MNKLLVGLATLLVSLLVAAAPASAQVGYFGQNKVQYRSFKFQVLKTDHFDIYYYTEEEEAARMAGRMAERWYARLSGILSHQLRGRQAVVLYGSGSQFRQTNVVEGELGEGTGGVTEAYKRRIVLPSAGALQSSDHVLGHELVHAFQYDITSTTANNAAAGSPGLMALPLWFVEGMAEYLSIGPDDPHTAMWMREAVRREKFPEVDKLDNPKYFPYRYGEALWAFIGGKYGDRTIGNLLRTSVGRDGYQGAFTRVLGVTSKELSQQWRDATVAAARPVAEATKMPSAFARPVIVDASHKGGLNVSPELSPDGSKVAFFSSRDLFSIDLYVADAATGKVLHRITDTATNPHLDSIEFIDSSGAWSHDGHRLVFPGIAGGAAVLTIVDADKGKKDREIAIKDVDEILNPTWSPDGNQLAFSALVGGFTDLFTYDIAAGTLRRLTNDPYAQLHPAWSPDGRAIAFSTDRFSTNLMNLNFGNLRLAIADAANGNVRPLGGFDDAKNINPQWSDDGRSLYFVSDREGISNIYHMTVDTGTMSQITNLYTGATGITELSPAMSASAGGVAFSVFEEDGYNIYALDGGRPVAELPLVRGLPGDAGILPPRTAPEGTVFSYLKNAEVGLPSLPEVAQLPAEPYKPKLSLDFIGQPVVGVGVDSFGSYVGGGVSAMFSDVLGNHIVAGDIQTTNRFDETGGTLLYLNRTHRWNWGVSLDQTPYVLRGFSQSLVDGEQPVVLEDETRVLQTDRGFAGLLAYPLNRARRFEFSGGLRQIGRKVDVTTRQFDFVTGQQLTEETQTLSRIPTLNLGLVSSAFVHDTSIFGATSPIRGSRARLQVDHTAGNLTYSSALADYRTYLMPVRPFTFALRGLYYGRYGRDAENDLLLPVFIGYPELVRGYGYGSFRSSECGLDGSCPVLDRLSGSRMLVANAELRFPLWGAFGGSNFYGPLPIELGVFADAGAAWDKGRSLHLTGADRDLVRSVGATVRVNLFGFAIGEVDYVRPLDRPGRGWLWQFSLRPGY
jgi:Tol biopolymer transport system component